MFSHNKQIFALDIGTRSVVGIILEKQEKSYQLVDYVMEEHKERSMVDGQIHDVVAVAQVIRKVKEQLEEKHGSLTHVAVAAAGRSLKTTRTTVSRDIAGRPLLTREDILPMELEAVQLAQQQLASELGENNQTDFYCVGYSVVQYLLDHEPIGNLIDQRGKLAQVEIISTFLPRVVVDSLISALKRADLEMKALTLEPIAAINVLIPATMRRLNIALVDIGAGTSDIAITSEGTITAFGMVPHAGDEITEAISQQFLLDFHVAESVKRQLYCQEQVSFTDVLGFDQQPFSIDVVKDIQPAIQALAEGICREILLLNGKAPQAVMLIGGGALTPTLNKWVAELLGLPANRVGIRGINQEQLQLQSDLGITGPESVTPVGIAIAAEQHPVKYLSATVNGNTVRLFDLRKLTIGDAIISSALNLRKLHGKPGMAISIEVNGRLVHVPGTHGQAPQVLCNGQPASLDQPLQENDQIELIKGDDGEDAQADIKDVLAEINTLDVTLNGTLHAIAPSILLNGQNAFLDTRLQDRDKLEIRLPGRVKEVLQELDINIEKLGSTELCFTLNGQEQRLEWKQAEVWVNKKIASLAHPIQNGDIIDIIELKPPSRTIASILPAEAQHAYDIEVTFNDTPVTLHDTAYIVKKNGEIVNSNQELTANDHITYELKPLNQLTFHDIFRYVDIDTSVAAKGKRMRVKINGAEATFDTPIKAGDHLELRWE